MNDIPWDLGLREYLKNIFRYCCLKPSSANRENQSLFDNKKKQNHPPSGVQKKTSRHKELEVKSIKLKQGYFLFC